MMVVDTEVDRCLTLLRNKIRQRGFTQLQVQGELSWGRSYISQLLTKQKSLRVEQVLLILDVISVEPADFFAELYHPPQQSAGSGYSDHRKTAAGSGFMDNFHEVRSLLRGLVGLLVDRDLLDIDELTDAVRLRQGDPMIGDFDPDAGPPN